MQLALFDFDHTITTCDSYSPFMRRIARPAQLKRAKWQIGPWLLGYRMGLVSPQAIRARATRMAFTGRDAADIAQQGALHARQSLPAMLRSNAMQRIAWHQSQGHTVVVVSASLDLYLQPWCEQHDLSWICNRLEQCEGVLTGRYDGADIGPEKARQIGSRYDLKRYERIHAYGDSSEDRPMLALAHERWYRGQRIA